MELWIDGKLVRKEFKEIRINIPRCDMDCGLVTYEPFLDNEKRVTGVVITERNTSHEDG